MADWCKQQIGKFGLRMLQYTANDLADYWCNKAHILLCATGELEIELAHVLRFVFKPGKSYQVADGSELHPVRRDLASL